MSVSIIAYIFEVVLLIWFFGCIVTYRLGNVLLVEGMGIKSVEFGMLVVYAASIYSIKSCTAAGGELVCACRACLLACDTVFLPLAFYDLWGNPGKDSGIQPML